MADPFQILYQKNYALCGNRLNLEFDLIQSSPIEPSVFSVARWQFPLGVVRGDEPDCPGKRNLLTALIGLQRAAESTSQQTLGAHWPDAMSASMCHQFCISSP